MKTYIDMTHMIEDDMPVWPGVSPPNIEETMTLGKDICTVQKIEFSNHLGTHLDSPSHFIKDAIAIDQIPLETLIGKAKILDFTVKRKNDFITGEDL